MQQAGAGAWHHARQPIAPPWLLRMQVRRLSGEAKWAPYVQLRKVKDHFIFTIESTGAWRPHELFNYAVQVRGGACRLRGRAPRLAHSQAPPPW